MKSVHDIILRPVVTERSMQGAADKKYVFEVLPSANKIEIRKAVEEIFGVKVESVNTVNVIGKMKRQGVHIGRRPKRKKAIVQLKKGSKAIEIFESMI